MDSATVLFIFQFPAIKGILFINHPLLRVSIPGHFFPSRNSRQAPPLPGEQAVKK
jgi:hypothetical protein